MPVSKAVLLRHTLLLLLAVLLASAQEPAFPLKASSNGRYLVDQRNQPFFYQADSPWMLARNLTLSEAEEYMDARKAQGFTAFQIHAISKEIRPATNRAGHDPFDPIDHMGKPVEAYWAHLEKVVEAAAKRNLLVGISASWIQWGGRDREGWRYQISAKNAGDYGRFLARRFHRFNNVLWILGGDANPIEVTAAIDEMGKAIHAVAPHQLITVHNKPEFASSTFFDAVGWLDVNFAYSYRETYISVLGEFDRIGKVRPIILGESGYENDNLDRRGGSPLRMRRQAYEAILSGAFGGHSYGHLDMWQVNQKWREALQAKAANQLKHTRAFFTAKPWYRLVPDQDNSLIVAGRGYFNEDDYVTGAVSDDRSFAVVYIPESREIYVDLARLGGPVTARWFDPTTGLYMPAAGAPVPSGAIRAFRPPNKNADWDSDFLLLLEVSH
jgi:hypothetical protein